MIKEWLKKTFRNNNIMIPLCLMVLVSLILSIGWNNVIGGMAIAMWGVVLGGRLNLDS